MNAEARFLVADIGGTNARFGLADARQDIFEAMTLRVRDYPDVMAAARAYRQHLGAGLPRQACFAVACPVLGDEVHFTNSPWSFSIEAARRDLELERLVALNDFAALALALPLLRPDELTAIGGGAPAADAPLGVLGPGTGLGVSGLIPTSTGFVALQGEGGHVAFAPDNPLEVEIWQRFAAQYGRVSNERVLCGQGLADLYQALAVIGGREAEPLDAAQILERAGEGGDRLAEETLAVFSGILGSVAGDLALTLGARGGIYIAGGIVPRFATAFAQGPFRARFEDKGRFQSYMARIPSWLVRAPQPALRGAAYHIAKLAAAGP